jgi:hypothetical protein
VSKEDSVKTASSCWLGRIALLFALFTVAVVLINCSAQNSTSESIQSQADRLMATYNLHPSDSQPSSEQFVLDGSSISFLSMASASSKIGLNLTIHTGEQVELLTYLLKEQSQFNMGGINAYFVASKGEIVGAWLAFEGPVGGGASALNDRSQFLPSGLNSDNLVFQNIKSMNVLGPWTVNNWKSEIELSDPESINKLLIMLEASTKQNGVKYSVIGDEQYAIRINYESGEVILARLTTKSDSLDTFLTFSPFGDCYFIPSDDLKPYVKNILGAL